MLGAVAAELVATSIARAILQAESLCGVPSAGEAEVGGGRANKEVRR